jgi:hypothetical protein
MARVERDIEVNVPVRTAYRQWTQFEEFPRFMEGVSKVRRLDDRRLHWRTELGGHQREWDAIIREQVPDERMSWESTSGEATAGTVTLTALDAGRTRVHLEMEYERGGTMEKVGDALGAMTGRVEGDLKRFKEFIERREGPPATGRIESDASDAGQEHLAGPTDGTAARLPRMRLSEVGERVVRGIRRGAREAQAKGLKIRKDREMAALGRALYPLLRSGQLQAETPEVRARMSRLEELEVALEDLAASEELTTR